MKPYDISVKDIVKDNAVRFVRYRNGMAFYAVSVCAYAQSFMFPVPIEDVGDATLHAQDKAIVFMRYIRRALEEGTFVPYVEDEDS